MPFLRFSRDRRGYETTALMHAFREHGRAQPRILYWFRSPAAVKVGRPAIDEHAIRLIEEHHPDLTFDWSKILESRAVLQADSERQSRHPPRAEAKPRRQPATEAEVPAGKAPGEQRGTPEGGKPAQRRRFRHRGRPAPDPAAVSDAETPAARATEAAAPSHATAAEQLFSPEDLTRLRGRYAALLARIDRAVSDSASAEPLRHAADALNPDTWVTRDDVTQALERYESTYRQLLDALGPRPRTAE